MPLRLPGILAGRYRFFVVGLLFLLSVINYLDRQTLSVLEPFLRLKFQFSLREYSYIVSAFLIAYAMGYAVGGRVVDRIGVKRTLGWAVLFWSVVDIAHIFARGWAAFASLRFLLGFGESFGPLCGAKAIGEWIPKKERAFNMSIFSIGMSIGAVIAPPAVAVIALRLGWQWAFWGTGFLGIVWLLAWRRFYDSPERQSRLTAQERAEILSDREDSPHAQAVSTKGILRNPFCYALFVARLLTDPLPFFFVFWLPAYLHHSRGFSLALIGSFAWIPFLVEDLGSLGGSWISDWLVRRGGTPEKERMRILFIAACITPLTAVAVRTRSAFASLACIAVVLAAHSCWISNLLTTITERVQSNHMGSVLGFAGFGGSIGAILATLLTGYIVSVWNYVPIFTALAFVHMTAFLVLFFTLRRHHPPFQGATSR